jgi:tetratricopeptide (TPR) repeat protein
VNESTKKLIIFAAIFALAAVVIFIVMPSGKTIGNHPIAHDEMAMQFPDSASNRMLEEIEGLKAQVAKEPKNVEHLIQIANQYFDLNRPKESVEFYEKALAIDSLNPFVMTDCAAMYGQLGQPDKALQYIDKALAIKPDLPQAYFNKGIILLSHKNQKQEAIAAWQKFVKIVGDTAQANYVRNQIAAVQAMK